MNNILEVKDLYVSNNEVNILKGISLQVQSGEILGIVGESGCGKSTLLRTIMAMNGETEKINNGDVLFKGKSLKEMKPKEMLNLRGSELGVVFQNPISTLNPVRKIGPQFVETMKSHRKISRKDALDEAAEMLSRVNLKDPHCILNSYPFELSGGMNQRVALALSMILKPSLLLADEPTSALDVTVQKQVIKELLHLREQYNMAMVLVTHSMGVISNMADKVAVLYGGTLVEYGEKETILQKPVHPYTRSLIRAVPKLGGTMVRGIKGFPPEFGKVSEGCIFAPRCGRVKERCRKSIPALKNTSYGTMAACFYSVEGEC